MKRLSLVLALIPGLAFAQQKAPDPVTSALYERYQRADMEAIQLRAQVTTLEREVADLKKQIEVSKPKEPEKK